LSSWRNDPAKYERKKRQSRKYGKLHKTKRREQSTLWRKRNPLKVATNRFEAKWGHYLTFTQYQILCRLQKNKCAICAKRPKNRHLAIDHNHKTNEFRGLLCFRCNSALSMANDSPEILRRMAKYLERGKIDVETTSRDDSR